MSTHKHIDKICCLILVTTLILTVIYMNGETLGIQEASAAPAYEAKLFDTSKVHRIEILMDTWDSFIETCTNEEYSPCSVIIDGEAYKNVAIRAKGNTSLSSVKTYGNNRYSFKIEFDGYDSSKNYYGLDKLCLNNVIQDNTYMKDHLAYTMIREAGAPAPLSSYAEIYINGEYFGLYLAVESIEESFLLRNYGKSYGELYKPDSMNMGDKNKEERNFRRENFIPSNFDAEKFNPENFPSNDKNSQRENGFRMPGGGMGSSDVKLLYSDDNPESYRNIFDNAKTDISDKDKKRLISSLKRLGENTDIENTINVEDVIRYFVAHNFALNFDSYTGSMIHNYYLYEENGILSMLPWDYNLAFGSFGANTDTASLINHPIDSPVSGGDTDSRPMLSWIFKNDEYTELYHKYFKEFITNFFDSGKFEKLIDSTYTLIAPYIEKDSSKFCTYEEFKVGIATLKEFCLLRAESISKQLKGKIPSTSEGQADDNSSFVKADTLSISAMGTMGFGRGMQSNDRKEMVSEGHPEIPVWDEAAIPKAPSLSDGSAPTESSNPESFGTPPENFRQGFGGRGMQPPNMQWDNAGESKTEETTDSIYLLLISVIVLLSGITFAFIYKRK